MRRSVALLGIVVLAGCGGGGGKRLGRDTYVAKADAICAKLLERQKALPAPASLTEIPAYVDRAGPIVDDAVAQLRDLRPPAEMEQGVDDWLDATVETRNELEKLRSAAESGDEQKVREVSARGNEMDDRRGGLARAIGLTACANT